MAMGLLVVIHPPGNRLFRREVRRKCQASAFYGFENRIVDLVCCWIIKEESYKVEAHDAAQLVREDTKQLFRVSVHADGARDP